MSAARAEDALDPSKTTTPGETTVLHLDATVNARRVGLARFTLRNGELLSTEADLMRLGLMLPRYMRGTEGPVALSSIAGLQHRYDALAQTVTIMAPLTLLSPEVSRVGPALQERTPPQSGSGMVFNYNLFAGVSGKTRSLSAASEVRLFTPLGVVSSSFTANAYSAEGKWKSKATRLDTTATISLPSKLISVTVGDGLTSGNVGGRAAHFGGIRVGSNFALQPYLITTPAIRYRGQVSTPSTVELYVGGARQSGGAVGPGNFEISSASGAGVGAGTAQIVVTDHLGRISRTNFDFYQAPLLLRHGLTEWSLEGGFLRRDYGNASFNYDPKPFLSGTVRRGVTDRLTVQAHAEGSATHKNVSVTSSWRAGQLGLFTGMIGRSGGGSGEGDRKRPGTTYAISYDWADRRNAISFNLAHTTSSFMDLPGKEGLALPRTSLTARASHSTDKFGTLGLSYTGFVHSGYPRAGILHGYWYGSITRDIGFSINATQYVLERKRRSIFATLSVRLGARSSANASVERSRERIGASVDVMRSVPEEGGLGWRTQLQAARTTPGGTSLSGGAELQYLGDHGQVMVGGRVTQGQADGYVGVSGSLLLLNGSAFAARQVNDGFAVVRTGGVADVTVRLRNNVVGKTNRKGELVVRGLNAYEDNALSIDVADLPADVKVARPDRIVATASHSGAIVNFDLTRERGVLVALFDGKGLPVPAGSVATLAGQTAVVGYDGETYFPSIDDADENVVEVRSVNARCIARFNVPKLRGPMPRISPVICHDFRTVDGGGENDNESQGALDAEGRKHG